MDPYSQWFVFGQKRPIILAQKNVNNNIFTNISAEKSCMHVKIEFLHLKCAVIWTDARQTQTKCAALGCMMRSKIFIMKKLAQQMTETEPLPVSKS